MYEIECTVEHMKRLFGRKLAQLKVVCRIKPGKQIRIARCARRGKIGADQPVPIGRVEGELVRVDEETHHHSHKRYGARERGDNEESSHLDPWCRHPEGA